MPKALVQIGHEGDKYYAHELDVNKVTKLCVWAKESYLTLIIRVY